MSPKRKTSQKSGSGQGLTPLQQEWTTLWTRTLPMLASSKAESGEEDWPVCIDRSIARIILDNAIGISRTWNEAVNAPATKHMNDSQLQACIDLSQRLINDEVNIWTLDTQSRNLRTLEPILRPAPTSLKRKRRPSSPPATEPLTKQTSKQAAATSWKPYSLLSPYPLPPTDETDLLPDIQYIILSSQSLTPFRRKALLYLTQVPRGRFTTYKAIAEAMGEGNGRSVGEVMRTNPFAPTVACHRMVGSGMVVGGWKGDWEADGGFFVQKRRLLREEGVSVDEKGRVEGEVWRGFVEVPGD